MGFFIDFSAQYLPGTCNHQCSELCSQSFARLIDFLIDLAPGGSENAVSFAINQLFNSRG